MENAPQEAVTSQYVEGRRQAAGDAATPSMQPTAASAFDEPNALLVDLTGVDEGGAVGDAEAIRSNESDNNLAPAGNSVAPTVAQQAASIPSTFAGLLSTRPATTPAIPRANETAQRVLDWDFANGQVEDRAQPSLLDFQNFAAMAPLLNHLRQQQQQQRYDGQPFNPMLLARPLASPPGAPPSARRPPTLHGIPFAGPTITSGVAPQAAAANGVQRHIPPSLLPAFRQAAQNQQSSRSGTVLRGPLAGRFAWQASPPSQQQQLPVSITTEQAIKAVISQLEAAGPAGDEMESPSGLMATPLLRHQRVALTWMSRREANCREPIGGILADDQGLGKTVTTIALVVNNPRDGIQHLHPPPLPSKKTSNATGVSNAGMSLANGGGKMKAAEVEEVDLTVGDGDQEASMGIAAAATAAIVSPKSAAISSRVEGGTLVVCPTTLLHQWAKEIRDKTTCAAGIEVYIYHGKSKAVLPQSLGRFEVVLTTYQTLVMEMPEGKKPPQKQLGGGGADESLDLTGYHEDEDGKPAKRRKKEPSDRGGPLFRVNWHRVVLDEAQAIKNARTLAAHAAWALKARRRWCLSGTPLQNSVDDLYSYFKFLRFEPYSKFSTFKELIKDPIAGANPDVGFRRLQAILQSILLRRTKTTKINGQPIIQLPERRVRLVKIDFNEAERQFYAKLEAEATAKVKELERQGTVAQNYVNMLWMCLRLRQACNHPRLVRKLESAQGQSHLTETTAAKKIAPATRTLLLGMLRDNLTECVACGDVPEDPVVSVCRHVFCRQCVATMVSMAGQGAAEASLAYHCPSCGHTLGPKDTFGADALASAGGETLAGDNDDAMAGLAQSLSDGSSKIRALMDVLRRLREEGVARLQEAMGLPNDSNANIVRSVSAARLGEALGRGSKGGASRSSRPLTPMPSPMEKVIVFSQWTSMLDIVQEPLRREKFEYRRLDGTMSINARQAAIEDFTSNPDVTVMLVSLKAASLGVNLVSANHVVMLDLWYNPSTEDQAIDRAHRIGQTRPVSVTRITIKDTIEDRILELQDKKKSMVEAALGEGGTGFAAQRLTAQDLRGLFRT